MSGEDAPRPYLENLIVPEIKTNKQTSDQNHQISSSDEIALWKHAQAPVKLVSQRLRTTHIASLPVMGVILLSMSSSTHYNIGITTVVVRQRMREGHSNASSPHQNFCV
jgi:hypothetical protein